MQKKIAGKTVEVKRLQMPTDPPIEIFEVQISDESSTWSETIPTEEALRWFFRGVQAGASQFGDRFVPLPEIPRHSVPFKS